MLWLSHQVALHEAQQAVPATPSDVRTLLSLATPPQFLMLLLQWTSASRYADISAMYLREIWLSPIAPHPDTMIVQFTLPVWKSDRKGVRKCQKQLVLPVSLRPQLQIMFSSRRFPSYAQMLALLHRSPKNLSMHSLRRGAIAALTPTTPPEEIIVLTQHAQGAQFEQRALRTYLPASPLSQEGAIQQRLSYSLLQMIL
jgi:hypothetical protein